SPAYTPTLRLPPLSLHDALPISFAVPDRAPAQTAVLRRLDPSFVGTMLGTDRQEPMLRVGEGDVVRVRLWAGRGRRGSVVESGPDRKSTRLNSSHQISSYAVFCL